MGLRERYRQLPPNPLNRKRRSLMIGAADAVITGMEALARATRRMTLPGETDRTIALTVAERQVVARDQDVVALTLVGADLPRWHPGSHLDIHLPSGLVRQYSLCGDPGRRGAYRIAVRRIADGGGGSIEMHELTVGATVTTHGPRNAFPLTVPGFGSPARRIRYRHHTDPADARPGAASRRRLVHGLRRSQPRQSALRRRDPTVRRAGDDPHR